LRLLLRLQDRPVRTRDRNCILRRSCAGQSDHNRKHTPAAELDFASEANHAVSNYQTVFAAVPTVKQNQPPAATSRTVFVWVARASRVLVLASRQNDLHFDLTFQRFNALTRRQPASRANEFPVWGAQAASRNELFCFRSPWTINDGSPVEETLNGR
jgi:hypothetical protein